MFDEFIMNITQNFLDISESIVLAAHHDDDILLQSKKQSRISTPFLLQALDLLRQINSYEEFVNSVYDEYVDYHQ